MSEYAVTKRPERQPTHPGTLLAESLEHLNLKIAPAARHLGISRQLLHRVLNGEAAVTPNLAVRIGKLCGNGPDLWANMQTGYDLWKARQELAAEIDSIPTLAAE